MKPKEIPLEKGKFYHIYNRGNNCDKIFFNQENYAYFLRLLHKYLSDYLHFYAFCLLPNHFHLLVQVKELDANTTTTTDAIALSDGTYSQANALFLQDTSATAKVPPFKMVELLDKAKNFSNQISFQFRKFFTAYSMAINKQQNRTGSLLQKNFKRIEITSEFYLKQLIVYIHTNPQLHGFVKDFTTYRWSSFEISKNNFPFSIDYNFILSLFHNKENYRLVHQQKVDNARLKNFLIEEE